MSKKSSRTAAVICPVTGLEPTGPIDRRVARSRAAIQAAFLHLILAHGYDAVGIKAICATAGVSRATFYAHFAGKDDLKRKGIDQMRRALVLTMDASSSDPVPFAFSRPLFEHARAHLTLYRALLGSRGETIAHEALLETLRDLVRTDLTRRQARRPRSLTVEFYAGALLSVLMWWLDGGARRPTAEVDAEFRALIG
jgi:AcrR family transcriptional regulator